MTRIGLVYFDAGGGHRSAATAIQEALHRQVYPWEASLINLQELLDPIDFVRSLTGLRVQDVYNDMLRNGWTLGSPELMRVLQWTIRAFHTPTVRLLEKHWATQPVDILVSLVPHFNRALCESFGKALPQMPFVTLLTDFADYPPHFWIERQKQFLICGSERAVEQARRVGHADDHIFQTSGMILKEKFYTFERVDRAKERERLGLNPRCLTGLVLFGGMGSKHMLEIDRRIRDSKIEVQLIFICGKNQKLADALRAQGDGAPRLIEEFTTDVPYYMQLADFFIGKPGPGSIAEAVAMGLPVIVERNAWTLPQERYNTDWVEEKQVGLVVRNFSHIAETVSRLLEPETFARFRANTVAMNNWALYEVPEILKTIVLGGTNSPPLNLRPGSATVAC